MLGQNPTTPSPPPASAGITTSGITYSLAKTDTSLALSCSFDESMYKSILELIRTEFPSFNGKLHSDAKLTDFEYKIILKEKELKIEYKKLSAKDIVDLVKLESLSKKILTL